MCRYLRVTCKRIINTDQHTFLIPLKTRLFAMSLKNLNPN